MSDSLILRAITRLLTALMLAFSVFILLRGHDYPGGGFIGALIATTAFILYAIAYGVAEVRRALVIDTRHIAVIGLGLALLAGLIAFLADEPMLTGLWLIFDIGQTEVKLSTVLIFDIGVYLGVIGAVLTLLLAMEEEE